MKLLYGAHYSFDYSYNQQHIIVSSKVYRTIVTVGQKFKMNNKSIRFRAFGIPQFV